MIIKLNKIQCKKCNDVIISYDRHDFKMCECKSVGVDGGNDYLKRTGNQNDIIELSIIEKL